MTEVACIQVVLWELLFAMHGAVFCSAWHCYLQCMALLFAVNGAVFAVYGTVFAVHRAVFAVHEAVFLQSLALFLQCMELCSAVYVAVFLLSMDLLHSKPFFTKLRTCDI
jgi:hypothetical protein